jgi:hypothetical protein
MLRTDPSSSWIGICTDVQNGNEHKPVEQLALKTKELNYSTRSIPQSIEKIQLIYNKYIRE